MRTEWTCFITENKPLVVVGPWRNQVSPTLPPKPWHILRSLAFTEIIFSNKKYDHLVFEITIRNHLVNFFNTDQNTSEKTLEHKLYRTLGKNFIWNLFWTLGSASTGTRMKVKVLACMSFLGETLPVVKSQFRKKFSHKVLYNYRSKKIFSSVLVNIKNI